MNTPQSGSRPRARPSRPAAAILCGLVLGPAVPVAVPAAPPKDPAVVARVNGRPILRRDFDLAVQIQFRGRASRVGLGELRAARDQILEALIDGELLYQKAARNGREPAVAEVAAEMKRLRDGFGSQEEFAATLRDNGVPEADFREQVRRSLVVDGFVEREVVGQSEVPESEMRQYYDQNPRDMLRPERVRFSQIFVRAPAGGPGARA
ncbi:MAG: SurA N-terminal domain-containing protein, partial [Candidatus Polarisedimenticolia bacterium]